jgi:hypothetical protein
MDTLVMKNVNPIEELDSTFIEAASILYNCSPDEILANPHSDKKAEIY